MVLEEKKVKDICNFYVSDYHLEIILLPYISKKIENKETIIVITNKNLKKTLIDVIERMNINKNKKEEIIDLGWDKKEISNINIIENTNIILIGSKEFIDKEILEIKKQKIRNIKLIVCYDYNEVKNNIQEIVTQYDGILNTQGINNY